MSGNVLHGEFGKEARESARRLARLLGLIEQNESAMLADPRRFMDMASERIYRLQCQIERAQDALRSPLLFAAEGEPVSYSEPAVMRVYRDEYERLRAAAAIIRGEP
jgi:hypothetical protein